MTPDRRRLTATTDAAGLLVLSEIANPASKATVDRQRTAVLTANHILRAITIPAGAHTIELRYESATLRAGLVLSLLAYGVAIAQLRTMRRRRVGEAGAG